MMKALLAPAVRKCVRRAAAVPLLLSVISGCKGSQEASVKRAESHVRDLVAVAANDVAEVRSGLPQAEPHLTAVLASATRPEENPQEVRDAIERARHKVQDLRVAKASFFALTDAKGVVLRNDQEQDLMVGKDAFAAYPELKKALSGQYAEARGSMPEAAGVKGRADGQWVAAQPIRVNGEVRGLYLAGWSWAAYAYRLEFHLRSKVRAQLAETKEKEPLVYVYVVVDQQAYGAPVSPDVNAEAIEKLDALAKVPPGGTFSTPIEITDRDFGLAVKLVPELGPKVGIAVLRSET